MGCVHLMISLLCLSQLDIFSHPLSTAKLSQPDLLDEILHAASANICQRSLELNNMHAKSEGPPQMIEWTPFNSFSITIICGVLIQEIFLATRNKMGYIFYSRLLGLIFVVSAVKTR